MFLTYTSRAFGTEGELRYRELGQQFDELMRAAWKDIQEARSELEGTAPAGDQERRAEALLKQAETLIEKGRNEAAVRWLQRVIDEYPGTQAAKLAERRQSVLSKINTVK